MSKLTCRCGQIISDESFPSPNEGEILREVSEEALLEVVGESIASFIHTQAYGLEQRVNWLKKNFGDEYPIDASNAEVIHDFLADQLTKMVLSIAECKQCGRMHIQRENGGNEYISYLPESGSFESILSP